MSPPNASWRWYSALAAGLVVLTLWLGARPALAHEVLPTIADFSVTDSRLELVMRLDVEALMAGLDLSAAPTAADPPEMAAYTALQSLPAPQIADRFAEFWPAMAGKILLMVDGARLKPSLRSLAPPGSELPGLARTFVLTVDFALPAEAKVVEIGWAATFGPLVLRQNGVDAPYDGYLEPGVVSPPIALSGGRSASGFETFVQYVPIGFDHIVPKGLDHILFVLGLFLYSPRLRPLFAQISAFTLAHTLTLAAAAANFITVPTAFVEPAIAASIIYVAVENLSGTQNSALRLPLIFAFGLLHGLGFASVLQEFGLPEGRFLPALIGFNLGVEIGQFAVIGAAFFLIGIWFSRHHLYRAFVVIPGSSIIGLVGAVWFVQRMT